MNNGWIRLYRTSFENPFYFKEKFTKWQAWIDILLITNHEDSVFDVRGNEVLVKRGQFAYPTETLAKRWKWSRTKIKNFLFLLEKLGQISQQKSNVLNTYTVINYETYQSESQQKSQQKANRKSHNKNDKNNNNNILGISDLEEIAKSGSYKLDLVKQTYEDLVGWMEEVPTRKKGRNYRLTLLNWLRKKETKIPEKNKLPIYGGEETHANS